MYYRNIFTVFFKPEYWDFAAIRGNNCGLVR